MKYILFSEVDGSSIIEETIFEFSSDAEASEYVSNHPEYFGWERI